MFICRNAKGVLVRERLGTPGLESGSAIRNNIHPNNKQKAEIANKNTRKITCQYGQPECERCFEAYVMIFTRRGGHFPPRSFQNIA